MLYHRIQSRLRIEKGWSGDKKYQVADDTGTTYLLRISPTEKQAQKQRQYLRMQQAAQLGIPMCLPVEFGLCEEGVYSLQSWISGQDAEAVMPNFPREQQYAYGLVAGRILKKLHTLPAPENAEPWSSRFNKKIDRKIAMYSDCPLKYPQGELFLAYIAQNRQLLSDRPQTYQHGDYHIGNMMLTGEGVLTILDFDRDDFGDPWEEFNRIVWCAQAVPPFAAGMVDGYFDGHVPSEFWQLLALYICSNTLSSLPWAIPFGVQEIQTMQAQAQDILRWYNNFTTVIPSWYREKP